MPILIAGGYGRPPTPATAFPVVVPMKKAPDVLAVSRNMTVIAGGLTAPPTLINPTVITGDPTGGSPYTFGNTEDVRFDVGDVEVNGAIKITGGRNIRIIGGKWLYTGAAPKTNAPDAAIIKWDPADVGGVMFLEGLHLDSNGVYMDHFALFSFGFAAHSVVIQNCYSEGIAGKASGVHADFIECFPGIDKITIEQTTFVTAHAGVFLPYHGSNEIGGKNVKWGPKILNLTRVNARVDEPIRAADRPNTDDLPTFMIYLQDGKSRGVVHGFVHDECNLTEVYCETRAGRSWWQMVFPTPGAAVWQSILHQPGGGLAEYVTFPAGMNTTGRVTQGPPPDGDFVNPLDVGRFYSSPWPI